MNSKQASRKHEEWVARQFNGVRSKSSGAAAHDRGDVRTTDILFECKTTGTYGRPAKSISMKLKDLEKIMDEAWSEGRMGAMALRIYNPYSVLADNDGNVDIICFLARDVIIHDQVQ
ncbi:MAG: hypothetical protein QXU32_02435 [Nitrososphaerales archaeon]